MLELIQRSGLLIPKEHQYKEFYIKIKEFLERRTMAYDRSNYTINRFYIESEKYLLIPRYFPIQQYSFAYSIKTHQHDGAPIEIEHNITPRSTAQEKAIKYMLNHENGIIQLAPGVGKTVISIYVIAERKVKTLILVHRDPLALQWRNRIESFSNLNADSIGRLTSANFKEELKKPVIISMNQTIISLLKRKREEFLYALHDANIGCFIADEVHTTVGAPTFSECSIHIPAKYTYGLSATPYRYDGNGDIIEFHLGEIFTDKDLEGTMEANVTVLLLDYEIDTPRRYTYVHWGGSFQRARYLNLMKKSKPFLRGLRGLLTKFRVDRNVLCMIERVKLIEEMHKWMPSKSKGMFCGAGPKLEELDKQITFSTPGKGRDGIDAPWKDCLIMTSPISNIEQLAGRVLRVEEGKKKPIVIDMVDCGSENISRTFYGRQKFYDDRGWSVQYLLFKNDKINKIDRQVTMSILEGQ